MPDFLGDGPGHEDGGGTPEGVGGSCVISVVGMFVIARDGVVFRVFKMTVCPAVGRVRAKVGAARRCTGRSDGNTGGCECGRWGDRARGGRGNGWTGGSAGGVSAVKTSRAGRGGEAAILVGCTKVQRKIVEGFLIVLLSPPVATGDFEQSGGEN